MNKGLRVISRQLGYSKELIEPIAKNDPKRFFGRGLLNPKSEKEWVEEESIRKLKLLFEHYKIDIESSDAHLLLIFRLALDWVPGFTVNETLLRRGAPTRNNPDALLKLVAEIDELKVKLGSRSKKFACGEFLKAHKLDERWKGRPSSAMS